MIFANPAGAPELACDECGCRWFDRLTNRCYECGAPVPPEARAEFEAALERFGRAQAQGNPGADRAPPANARG